MSYRTIDGLPGYVVREGRLALNVKVYRSTTAEEIASVETELGLAGREADAPNVRGSRGKRAEAGVRLGLMASVRPGGDS